MKKTKLLLICSMLALFTTTIASLNIHPIGSMTETVSGNPVTIHVGTIDINANGDFATYASSGDGSQLTPWIIENLVLNGNGSGYIFDIDGTTDHFIIRNCLLYNTTSNGIDCYQVGNGTFLNNTITDVYTGIYIEDGSNFQVINNTITNNAQNGVETNSGATYLLVHNNTLSHNGYDGAYFWGTNHSIITDNTLINNTNHGMTLDDGCTNNTIAYNTMNNNTDGLFMDDDNNFNRIRFNILNYNSDYGIDIYDRQCNYNTFLNNTVNSNGQAGIFADESSHNTFINNTAKGNTAYGAQLGSSAFNFTFLYNDFSFNLDSGMYIECDNNSFTYNRANNNTNYGIYLNSINNNTLTLNTANGNNIAAGIFLDTCFDTTVTWNVLHYNPVSVLQSGGSGNIVVNNSAGPATLTQGGFTPATGDTGTTYTFFVNYTDIDGLAPFSIRVIIDGTPYDMIKQNLGDNDYTDGSVWTYSTTLPEGPHLISFECYDITHKVTTTAAAGPTVTAPPIPGFSLLMLLIPLLGLTLVYFAFKKYKVL